MDLKEIEAYLKGTDTQNRLKAITELRNYDADVAVPLLLTQIQEREFIIRSFVAMGLGKKRTEESFAALLQMMKFDQDSNVRAEAANSLSLFGQISASHLVATFYKDEQWLVRRSIIAALAELDTPAELFEVCTCAIGGEDPTVQEAAIEALALLADTNQEGNALEQLLLRVEDPSWRIRARVAKSLSQFQGEAVTAALAKLREDEDHRVVGSVLEQAL